MVQLGTSVERDENVPGSVRPSLIGGAQTALNLVHQAAEVFRSMEDHARETEARARALCQSAAEKLRLADVRTDAAERAQRELVIETERKLQDASRALAQAQSRIQAQEDKLTAAEFRAQAAEAEARQTRQALALVEEAIRKRLICATEPVPG